MSDDIKALISKHGEREAKEHSWEIECICDRPEEGFCWYHLTDNEKAEQSYKTGHNSLAPLLIMACEAMEESLHSEDCHYVIYGYRRTCNCFKQTLAEIKKELSK